MRIGIFADRPDSLTESAIICNNIARELTDFIDRVVYFGRGNMPQGQRMAEVTDVWVNEYYEVVNCESGNWKEDLIEQAIQRYKLDIILANDLWNNITGLLKASQKYKIPFHFLTPNDEFLIPKGALQTFKKCAKVYIPNSSYKNVKNGCFLPYGVDYTIFRPVFEKKSKRFTFLWVGEDNEKKDLGSAFLAFEKIIPNADVQLVILTNWTTEQLVRKTESLKKRKMPIFFDKMIRPFHELSTVFNTCSVYLCTSKVSAWEMEITEALACGLPVLCTDAPFMNQHILNEKNGFLIPTENGNISIEKLAEKMLWFYNNPKNVIGMGMWGAGDIREKYSWKKTADILYSEMI